MKNYNFKFKIFYFSIVILIFAFYIFNSGVSAQSAINLSISPPIFELMIKPDKDVKQIFKISNQGGDTVITPKILYFIPSDDSGNVTLSEDQAPDWVIYNKEPFTLKGQDSKDFEVLFSPSADTPEIDHFLTIVFETSAPIDVLNQNLSLYQSRIGSNILLTVSKDGNPKKSAKIVEFSAPRVVDSFQSPIRYSLTLANNGNSFWKPIGKITTKDDTLNLAPQNIISGTSRMINCIDNENLIDCKLDKKFRIGKIVSKLEFSIENDSKIYTAEATTYVFPFTLIGIVILLLTVSKFKPILKLWQKIKV